VKKWESYTARIPRRIEVRGNKEHTSKGTSHFELKERIIKGWGQGTMTKEETTSQKEKRNPEMRLE
jgi:hypothetical protein